MQLRVWLVLVSWGGACGTASAPQTTSSEPPAEAAGSGSTAPLVPPSDLRPFLAAGCSEDHGALSCPGYLGDFACSYVVADDLGGLGLPIVECGFGGSGRCGGGSDKVREGAPRPLPDEDLGRVGCMCPLQRRMIVAEGSGFEPIYSRAALAKRVGPIDSEAKALSFAAAVTNGHVRRELPRDAANWTTKGADTQPSFARRDGARFVVRLFEDIPCRCMTPNELTFTDYAVTPDGGIEPLASGLAGKQLKGDICVD